MPEGWLVLEVVPGQADDVQIVLQDEGAYDSPDMMRDYLVIHRVVPGRCSRTP